MCSRRSCHSRETSCHGSRSSCHESEPSCHYIIQRQPVQKYTYCPPVQPCCPPMQSYCPPVQRYCPPCPPPVQRYCPQYTKNICKLPQTFPKY
ncbi:uncharacterized protein LJ264_014185 [Porphyrio hochstetteri]